MKTSTVYSKGIFNALPTFPEHDGKQYMAIVTGANGISGAHIVRTLSESPHRWKRIYALSRKPPHYEQPANVTSIAADFLKSPEEIAEILAKEGIMADYVFFASYIQPPPKEGEGLWSDSKEMERLNVSLLTNFLSALEIGNNIPKRFVLQTGAKHYGLHLGPPLSPEDESDPRFLKEPNFYFPQEDFLWEWSKKHGTSWNVTRPGFIIGAVRDAAMNITYGFALYAAVQAELGLKLEFPGDNDAWYIENHMSYAPLIAYHAEWAALDVDAADQILNISDGSMFTFGKFWPQLAAAYGLEYAVPEQDETKFHTVTMPTTPPPRGFGPPGKFRLSWSFEAWAQKKEVRDAWAKLKDRHGLSSPKDPFSESVKDVFGLLDAALLGPWGRSMSVSKSRKLGWNGFVDTSEGIFTTIREMSEMKMVPPPIQTEGFSIKYIGY